MKKILIIGAGVAGLSAGCYAQMNGYQTQIFELHNRPGGLCTSWKRKEYTFDGCIEWLLGSKVGTAMNRMWQELGAVQGRRFFDYDVIQRIEGSNRIERCGSRAFSVYSNIDQLERHMKELAPADSAATEELCNNARRLTPFIDMDEPTGLLAGIKMLPFAGIMLKYGRMSTETFIARFTDPFLRRALAAFFDYHSGPVAGAMYILAAMHNHDAGFPAGGSLAFARAIERRYLDLGGVMHYGARVAKVLVEPDPAGRSDRAVGVRLMDGSEHGANIVISAADGHATIFDLLEGQYVSKKVRRYYETLHVYPSWVQVSLGVTRDLSDEAPLVSYWLDDPVHIAGKTVWRIDVRHYSMDPSMAPPGKSAVVVLFASDHACWKALYKDPERYAAEKKNIAFQVIDRLECWLPGISGQIEVVDVSTPMTVERYTGNWQGSMEGWFMAPDTPTEVAIKGMDKTLPGLANFYMAGQWVEPTGSVPGAASSGRSVIRMICKKDKKAFRTNIPAAL